MNKIAEIKIYFRKMTVPSLLFFNSRFFLKQLKKLKGSEKINISPKISNRYKNAKIKIIYPSSFFMVERT
jgi:hypothetical protein